MNFLFLPHRFFLNPEIKDRICLIDREFPDTYRKNTGQVLSIL